MTSGRLTNRYNIFTAQATTGTSETTLNVTDFRNIVVRIGTAENANLTVKAQGAIFTTTDSNAPDFSASQSVTNHWDYVQMIDLSGEENYIDGNTGFVVTGTDKFKNYELNVNSLDYVTFSVTARSAGSVTIDVLLTDNK